MFVDIVDHVGSISVFRMGSTSSFPSCKSRLDDAPAVAHTGAFAFHIYGCHESLLGMFGELGATSCDLPAVTRVVLTSMEY